MIDKIVPDVEAAVAGVADGATVLVGGFGMAGMPVELIDALIRQGAGGLTVVSNNAGNGDTGLAALLATGRVRKMICSFPRQADSWVFDGLYRAGRGAHVEHAVLGVQHDAGTGGQVVGDQRRLPDPQVHVRAVGVLGRDVAGDGGGDVVLAARGAHASRSCSAGTIRST